MKYLLHRPLPDEILTSALIRTCRRLNLGVLTVLSSLYPRLTRAPLFFQVSQVVRLPWPTVLSPLELLWRHSAFPYSSAFWSNLYFDSAVGALLFEGERSRIKPRKVGIYEYVKYRRFCKQCVFDDLSDWGTSYWHRSHNIPGVLVCLKHDTFLSVTHVESAANVLTLELPQDLRASSSSILRGKITTFDRHLARNSLPLLELNLDGRPGFFGESYRQSLIEAGLLSSSDPYICHEKLGKWIAKSAGSPLTRYGLSDRDMNLSWLRGFMCQSVVPAIKCLILLTALSVSRSVKGPFPGSVEVLGKRDPDAEDRRFSGKLEGIISTSIRAGSRLNIRQALTKAGCSQITWAKRRRYPLIAKQIQRLRDSDAHFRVIAARDEYHATQLARVIDDYLRAGKRISVKNALAQAGCLKAFLSRSRDFPLVGAQVIALKASCASWNLSPKLDQMFAERMAKLTAQHLREKRSLTVDHVLEVAGCKNAFRNRPKNFPLVALQVRAIKQLRSVRTGVAPRPQGSFHCDTRAIAITEERMRTARKFGGD